MKNADDIKPVLQAYALYEGLVRHAIMGHDTGLSKTQEMALVVLQTTGPLSVGRIARWLAVSREQASRAVGMLEKKGLVAKARDGENWRVVIIQLTPSGETLADEMLDCSLKGISTCLEVLDSEQREKFIELSEEISDLLSPAASKLVDGGE